MLSQLWWVRGIFGGGGWAKSPRTGQAEQRDRTSESDCSQGEGEYEYKYEYGLDAVDKQGKRGTELQERAKENVC